MYLDSNRQQALKSYIKEMQDNIEMNILAQRDCHDQLSSFFDSAMNNMLKVDSLDIPILT